MLVEKSALRRHEESMKQRDGIYFCQALHATEANWRQMTVSKASGDQSKSQATCSAPFKERRLFMSNSTTRIAKHSGFPEDKGS